MCPIFPSDLLVSVRRISFTIDVHYGILLFSTQGVDFNSSLKFSFDLSLPGKKTSRKTPSSRKVKIINEIWVSFIHWKTETALKIDCTLDLEMISLFSFLFFFKKNQANPNPLISIRFSWISRAPELYLGLISQYPDPYFLCVIPWTYFLHNRGVY